MAPTSLFCYKELWWRESIIWRFKMRFKSEIMYEHQYYITCGSELHLIFGAGSRGFRWEDYTLQTFPGDQRLCPESDHWVPALLRPPFRTQSCGAPILQEPFPGRPSLRAAQTPKLFLMDSPPDVHLPDFCFAGFLEARNEGKARDVSLCNAESFWHPKTGVLICILNFVNYWLWSTFYIICTVT